MSVATEWQDRLKRLFTVSLEDLNPFKRQETYAAIDIGSSSIKVLEVRTLSDQLELLNWGSIPTPPSAIQSNMVSEPDRVGEAIKALLEAKGIRSRKAITAVPGPAVMIKRVTLPGQSAQETEQTIMLEAGNFIPEELDNVNLDYQVMDWNTVLQRRTSLAPPDKGGWNREGLRRAVTVGKSREDTGSRQRREHDDTFQVGVIRDPAADRCRRRFADHRQIRGIDDDAVPFSGLILQAFASVERRLRDLLGPRALIPLRSHGIIGLNDLRALHSERVIELARVRHPTHAQQRLQLVMTKCAARHRRCGGRAHRLAPPAIPGVGRKTAVGG